jgi:hypothetical protein
MCKREHKQTKLQQTSFSYNKVYFELSSEMMFNFTLCFDVLVESSNIFFFDPML